MRWQSLCQKGLHVRLCEHKPPSRIAQRHLSSFSPLVSNISSILDFRPIEPNSESDRIKVNGHVRTIRNQKNWSFVEIGDGSTTRSLQAILHSSQAAGLGTGTAVTISGVWRACPLGKEQSHELHAEEVSIVGATDAETYPIQKKFHSAEYLRTIPHLRLRIPINALLARLRSDCDLHISHFFQGRQFIRIQPPIVTSSDCEGAGEVFTITSRVTHNTEMSQRTPEPTEEFFVTPKYLTVSSQLHLEAFIHEHQRVWTLSPAFRAEKSDTPRHLSEFYMLEAELRTESLQELMDLVEDLIRSIATGVRTSRVGQELLAIRHTAERGPERPLSTRSEVLQRRWQGLERGPWVRMSYSKAIQRLQTAVSNGKANFRCQPLWGLSLRLEHEKFLAEEVGQGSPVFIVDYPQSVKPFYMLPSDKTDGTTCDGQSTVACFDLLLPEVGEVAGGSLREHRLEPLLQSMQRNGLSGFVPTTEDMPCQDPQAPTLQAGNLEWYTDLRRYGSVPHGGFGLGFDRLLGYLAGVDNVRDVVPWPRYYGKCDG